jgi:hypothetical protein
MSPRLTRSINAASASSSAAIKFYISQNRCGHKVARQWGKNFWKIRFRPDAAFPHINNVLSSDIPNEVLEFISEQIASMEQLEVLLLVSSQPDREWSAEAVFSEIQSSLPSVTQRLQDFCERGLMVQPRPLVFRYSPATRDLAETIRALSAAYKEKRVKIIETIYRKPLDDVQTFADAFKLRKDNPNG